MAADKANLLDEIVEVERLARELGEFLALIRGLTDGGDVCGTLVEIKSDYCVELIAKAGAV